MERKIELLEQELKQTAYKYKNLYENSPDMHVSVDPDKAIIKECNQTLASKTGYTKAEIIGQTVFFMYHPDCMPRVEKAFESFVKTGHVKNAELELKKKDGTKVPVLLNVEAVKDADGKILYSNSCWRDISEVKQLKSKLSEANRGLEKRVQERTQELELRNKELEQFAYVASHDLQEPLRTVISFTELLEKRYNGQLDETADKYLTYVKRSGIRMSELVKGLLDYSRLGKGKELTMVDCNGLIKAVQDDLASIINDSNTTFEISDLPELNAYEVELRLLFQNIITNAIKFRKDDQTPTIKVSAQKEKGNWKFSFQDNGIGIADEYQERIFTIFQRLHNKNEYEGTGIGLAHCKKITDLHGGEIWVDSKPDEGSTFYVTIPILK